MSNSKPAETLHRVGSPADQPARTSERSQGTDYQRSAPNLQRFSKEARAAAKRENDRSALLKQIGELLLEHSTCGIIFEVSVPLSSTANELDQSDATMRTVASRYTECPRNLPQWAFSAATKAGISGKTVLEDATDGKAGPVALAAIEVESQNNNTDRKLATILVGIFVGTTSEQAFPFLKVTDLILSQWSQSGELRATRQLAADVACLQAIATSASDADSVQTGCRRIVNSLQQHLAIIVEGGTDVYIGPISGNKFPKLAAVSGCDSLPEEKHLIEALEATMAECISRNSNSCWPLQSDTDVAPQRDCALMCHKKLSQQLDNAAVTTFSMIDSQGEPKAVLLVRSDKPLERRVVNFLSTAQTQLGVTLSVIERGEQNKLQKFWNWTRESLAANKTRTILKALAAVVLLGLIPMPYNINATSEIQPAEKKFIYAPFAAPLEASLVEPGDILLKGAELARLDDRELQLELADVEAQLHRAQKQMDGFVASHETGEARLARHEIEMLVARRDLLSQRVEQLTLLSPVDGIVIAGDWKNSNGMPLETGQSMFEIAPLEKLSVDVFLPEDDVPYAAVGQDVWLKFDAYPFESFSASLKRIHPASEIQNNQNVFVATVELDNPDGKLRPGMKGYVKCQASWHTIWWNLLHKPAARCLRYVGW